MQARFASQCPVCSERISKGAPIEKSAKRSGGRWAHAWCCGGVGADTPEAFGYGRPFGWSGGYEQDYGGAFDGFTVTSDADPGL